MENKNTSSQLPTALKIGNAVTTDKSTIIENFNKQFPTAGHATWLPLPRSTALHPPQQPGQASPFPLLPNPVSPESGPLQISRAEQSGPFLLKIIYRNCCHPYYSPVQPLFRIPKDWKAAAVIPLFKGGDTLDPNCYRLISILPCLSKIFESQVNKQISDHFESHHTFSAMQSGFRAGHGCTSATLKTTPFCILLALLWTLR
ncbi:unnamed protein product [Oncorhynchus mykiss]|uniref:Reverse transcriptase domain-containing protein n=1 Tax=Oncorhynchus mykiss TaxID=8022 RepID=A0A060YFM3_ONCMY|nr:unnamed protein product [Oncorhynchus mykiss]